jgi:UDP-N-acetylglucosamine--N-acetylmuramyl-(pentapeptide) pyrophosphoryl-undecaprenol N-acetylglucosamine transferase
MNIIIAGGGTGGHVFPAIALARHIREHMPESTIIFVGTKRGLESCVVTEEGFEFKPIRSEGLVGKNVQKTLKALFTLGLSFYDAYRIIRQVQPHIVIGVGGYSSGAVVMTAFFTGIPTLIHEQNSVPGLANKILSRFSQATAISYEESRKFFPHHKVSFTGNPVREEIAQGDREKGYNQFELQDGLFTIFVFGGSLGAHSINNAVMEALYYLADRREKIQFLHQTGKQDFGFVSEGYYSKGFTAAVRPFIKEMANAYAAADLVISRAGAIALAEITLCGKASIVIPYPYAAGDHQSYNAQRLSKKGAVQIIDNEHLDGKTLAEHIINLLNNKKKLKDMESASRELGAIDASQKIFDLVMKLVSSRKSRA